MKEPKDADWYGWDQFVEWAEDNNVPTEYDDDWNPWWTCWKAGYNCAMNTHG